MWTEIEGTIGVKVEVKDQKNGDEQEMRVLRTQSSLREIIHLHSINFLSVGKGATNVTNGGELIRCSGCLEFSSILGNDLVKLF